MAIPTLKTGIERAGRVTEIGSGMATPTIIMVGAGFGGLATTKALRKTSGNIILIDRTDQSRFSKGRTSRHALRSRS